MTSRVIPSDDDGNHTTVIRCMAHELGCWPAGCRAGSEDAQPVARTKLISYRSIAGFGDMFNCSLSLSLRRRSCRKESASNKWRYQKQLCMKSSADVPHVLVSLYSKERGRRLGPRPRYHRSKFDNMEKAPENMLPW